MVEEVELFIDRWVQLMSEWSENIKYFFGGPISEVIKVRLSGRNDLILFLDAHGYVPQHRVPLGEE